MRELFTDIGQIWKKTVWPFVRQVIIDVVVVTLALAFGALMWLLIYMVITMP